MSNNKATLHEMNTLHGMVAKQLAIGIEDPKTLALAIKFLKDNDVTADIMESDTMMTLTESIKRIAKDAKGKDSFSVDDMLETASALAH